MSLLERIGRGRAVIEVGCRGCGQADRRAWRTRTVRRGCSRCPAVEVTAPQPGACFVIGSGKGPKVQVALTNNRGIPRQARARSEAAATAPAVHPDPLRI